jgi:hypothetical protein
MNNLLDVTGGRRVSFEELDLPAGLIVGTVILGNDVIVQLSPPCDETCGLSYLFLNGRECRRFICLDEFGDAWLADDGEILTASEIADLPLQLAATHHPLTIENLRRFDS